MNKSHLYLFMFGLLFSAIGASAGVVIKETATSDMMGLGGTTENYTIYISRNNIRIERYVSPIGIMGMVENLDLLRNSIILRKFDNDTITTLDTAMNTYCFMDISELLAPLPKDTNTYVSFETAEDSTTDTLEWIMTLDSSLVSDSVNGLNCRYVYLHASGIDPQTKTKVIESTIEAWLSNEIMGLEQYMNYKQLTQNTIGGGHIAEEMGVFDIMRRQSLQLSNIIIATSEAPIRQILRFRISAPKRDTVTNEVKQRIGNLITGDSISIEATIARLADFLKQKSDDGLMDLISAQSDLISVEEKDLPDSLFEIPAGYTEKEYEP